MATNKIREEEVKNKIRQEFFQDYDATPILGDIDFAVTIKKSSEDELSDQEYFLWAEAKAGNTEDIYESFVQLIITIGKAHTHESYLPPRYLGAFDEDNPKNDFQHQSQVFFINKKEQLPTPRGWWITQNNLIPMCIFVSVRKVIEATWLNDRDQFLYPNDGWKNDREFQNNCLVFTLFSNSNNIQSQHGTNHWIPFSEEEVGAQDNFESHFMHDFIMGKAKTKKPQQDAAVQNLFAGQDDQTTDRSCFTPTEPLKFSQEAQTVLNAGRELWRYYHKQAGANPNASYYDIKMHFQGTKTTKSGKVQMNSTSEDATYNALLADLRQSMKLLAAHIEPKVYDYGFLKK